MSPSASEGGVSRSASSRSSLCANSQFVRKVQARASTCFLRLYSAAFKALFSSHFVRKVQASASTFFLKPYAGSRQALLRLY